MNFVYPVTVSDGSNSRNICAQWFEDLSVVPGHLCVALVVAERDCGVNQAGMYYMTKSGWQLVMPYSAVCASIINGAQLTVYTSPVSQITAPNGSNVYRNGYVYNSATIPAGTDMWLVQILPGSNTPVQIQIPIWLQGTLSNSETAYEVIGAVGYTLPVGLVGSVLEVDIAPAASMTLTLEKNGSSIGTITWAAGQRIGIATFASAVAFAAGTDKLSVIGPATADTAASNFTLTLLAQAT